MCWSATRGSQPKRARCAPTLLPTIFYARSGTLRSPDDGAAHTERMVMLVRDGLRFGAAKLR